MSINTISYKGYTVRIEFDARDEIFVGRVLGVSDVISFHADTVSDLHVELEKAVDAFLLDCEVRGIKPEKSASGRLMLRILPEIHVAATVAAQSEGKSLNQWATEVLKRAVSA